jgi:hypothetical protein
MRWEKRGRIFEPRGDYPWIATHAALPVVLPLPGGDLRIYVSGRDERGRARIGSFETSLDGGEVRNLTPEPVVDLGPLGAFDDSGVTSSCAVERDGRIYLYYTGWALGVTVPFYFYGGLAVSDDRGESFEKVSAAPILERSDVDPFLTASPWVIVDDGVWRMWYVSCCRWEMHEGAPRHYYHIRYAESADGIAWKRTGHVAVDFETADEYAFARPCVVKDEDVYRMWYAVRGERYRIGYAESRDGLRWERRDALGGVEPSADGWDSEMVEYPVVFDRGATRCMLYNGNGYGKSGVGLATTRRSREDEIIR